MKLYYREIGTGKPLIVLHGLLGSGENWQTIMKGLENQCRIFLLDQRNHGNSPSADSMSYSAMADDVFQFVEEKGLESVILLGHSMGGKTAMEFALRYPEKTAGLIVVDIAPREYSPTLRKVLERLHDIDVGSLAKRSEAEEKLKPVVPERRVRLFLLKNLKRNASGGFFWKVNLDVLTKEYREVWKGLQKENRTYQGPVLFIRGEKSSYIQDDDEKLIKGFFPRAVTRTIPDAGHWLHAEETEMFLSVITQFLK